jgi:hypothetical protein
MSIKTRIKRPTTNTPRKAPTGRMLHQSTDYGWIQTIHNDPRSARFVALRKGTTFRSK